jgi:hypothetical protein
LHSFTLLASVLSSLILSYVNASSQLTIILETIEQQTVELQKLNAIISATENEMRVLKKQYQKRTWVKWREKEETGEGKGIILLMKGKYEAGVEERNFTGNSFYYKLTICYVSNILHSLGIQLIDRNDELCILYEKSNIQESIIRNGDIELRRKEEV